MYDEKLVEFCKNITPIKLSVTKNSYELEMKKVLILATHFLNDLSKVPLVTRFYCILNNITEVPQCASCKNSVTYNSAYPSKGFSEYCSPKCSRSDKTISKDSLNLLMDKDWLYDQRIILEKSKEKIAEELGCSISPVNKWIKVHSIPDVKYNESNSKVLVYLKDYSWLYEEYVTKHRSPEDIGLELGVSRSTVWVYVTKHGLPINSSNSYDRKIIKVSKPTLEIKNFIRTFYSGEIKLNVRGVIGNLELDIFIPELNFAIEYNGVYSHLYRPECKSPSEEKGLMYHVTKTNLCEQQGITLIQIFSSSWNKNKEIWKSMIRNKFKHTEHKIYARTCTIKEVSVFDKNTFLSANHLQGKDKSKLKYGLYHNDELVSLMTFGTARYNKNYDWELIRFCNKINTNVVGSFSKLLNHFKKNNSGSIISYADRTYSNGYVYESNGFSLLAVNKPNYYYVKKNTEIMQHRSNFTKSKILNLSPNPSWTEEQIMFNLDYHKIYDCGTKTYVMN